MRLAPREWEGSRRVAPQALLSPTLFAPSACTPSSQPLLLWSAVPPGLTSHHTPISSVDSYKLKISITPVTFLEEQRVSPHSLPLYIRVASPLVVCSGFRLLFSHYKPPLQWIPRRQQIPSAPVTFHVSERTFSCLLEFLRHQRFPERKRDD